MIEIKVTSREKAKQECDCGACPLCGLDTKSDNPDIIKIRTKRRSTVLVHKDCYIKAQGVHYDIQSHFN